MRTGIKSALFLGTLLCSTILPAQEIISGLVARKVPAAAPAASGSLKVRHGSMSLSLPFIDDFSSPGPVTNAERWSANHCFLNHSYGIEPRSVGVLSLDALDATGGLHHGAQISRSSFDGDTLSSRPINLQYEPADSLYLSFFYQAGGLGDRPETGDSLILDFFAPSDSLWTEVWAIPGQPLSDFTQVMIPIREERFLQDRFRFRFRNKCSLPVNDNYPDQMGNVDLWHLDYIRLDANRSINDTLIRDLAFYEPMASLLKNYSAVPWSRFSVAYNNALNSPMTAHYRNNDELGRNVSRSFRIIRQTNGETVIEATPTARDIPAFQKQSVSFPFYLPVETGQGDSASFLLEAALRSDDFDLIKGNDTIRRLQTFSDFYAYDDGTPEAGYGLRGQGTRNASVAVKFKSFGACKLGGVEMYFNQLRDSVNLNYYFNLKVWDEGEDRPGSLLHNDEQDLTPVYTKNFPGSVRYYFSEPVDVNDIFYVGWTQLNEYMLNIGLDMNNRPVPHVIYYNQSGEWIESAAPGVLLLRPFLYSESQARNDRQLPLNNLHIYPNPASGFIQIGLPDGELKQNAWIEVYNLQGQSVMGKQLSGNQLSIEGLPGGLYMIRLRIDQKNYSGKLLITH